MNHLFDRQGPDRYMPTPAARGPWTPNALHGSPPAMLLAHALERAGGDSGLKMARMTFDLFRAVPYAPLEVKSRTVRDGKRIKAIDAWLLAEGTEVARATGLMLRADADNSPGGEASMMSAPSLPRRQDVPVRHLIDDDLSEVQAYHARIVIRRIGTPGTADFRGAWIHLPLTLLPGESLTPVLRVASVADYASPLGSMVRLSRRPFINADINAALHREPESEWIGLQVTGRGDWNGLTTTSVNLHDERGLFGHCTCSGMSNPAGAGNVGRIS